MSRSFQFSSLSARQVIPSSQYSNLRMGCISQYVARVVGFGLSKKCLVSNISKPLTRTNSLFPLCLIVLFNTLVVKFGCFGSSRRTRGVNSATTEPLLSVSNVASVRGSGRKPVFPTKDDAISYAQTRARFRTGEIRVMDSTGNVERTIAFNEADGKL